MINYIAKKIKTQVFYKLDNKTGGKT